MTTPSTPWLWLQTCDGDYVRVDQIVAVTVGVPTDGRRTIGVTLCGGRDRLVHEVVLDRARHSGEPSQVAEQLLTRLADLQGAGARGIVSWDGKDFDLAADWSQS